jgi:hypothetical protein
MTDTGDQAEPQANSKTLTISICLTITAPLLMILFCVAEPNYAMWEYGVLPLVGLLLICSVVVCGICLFAGMRSTGFWTSIVLGLALAVGPFISTVIGVNPNPHGLGVLLWALYLLVAWAVSGCLIIINLWKCMFRKRPILGIK